MNIKLFLLKLSYRNKSVDHLTKNLVVFFENALPLVDEVNELTDLFYPVSNQFVENKPYKSVHEFIQHQGEKKTFLSIKYLQSIQFYKNELTTYLKNNEWLIQQQHPDFSLDDLVDKCSLYKTFNGYMRTFYKTVDDVILNLIVKKSSTVQAVDNKNLLKIDKKISRFGESFYFYQNPESELPTWFNKLNYGIKSTFSINRVLSGFYLLSNKESLVIHQYMDMFSSKELDELSDLIFKRESPLSEFYLKSVLAVKT
jgi:hypothetical protein